jgi:hypothetical protein
VTEAPKHPTMWPDLSINAVSVRIPEMERLKRQFIEADQASAYSNTRRFPRMRVIPSLLRNA